ncbi:MAG: hypothetical protein J7639_19815 [Paenibacillaceae bacterium]|nr:hypothetical protein [Paenibacillaceae bacterium]
MPIRPAYASDFAWVFVSSNVLTAIAAVVAVAVVAAAAVAVAFVVIIVLIAIPAHVAASSRHMPEQKGPCTSPGWQGLFFYKIRHVGQIAVHKITEA